MESMTGEDTNIKNLEENPLLPPNTSVPSNVTPVSEDCGPSGSKEELIHDQPSSPENTSMEEHFSWLIDFLDEPDTPVKISAHHPRLHSNPHNFPLEEWRQRAIMPFPLWGSHEFVPFNHGRHYFPDSNWFFRQNYTVWRPELNMPTYSNSLHAAKEKDIHPSSSGLKLREHESLESNAAKNPEREVSPEELKSESENKDVYSNSLHAAKEKDIDPSSSGLKLKEHEALESNAAKNPEREVSPEELKSKSENKDVSQTDSKQVIQQIPQRSRVRKLQYITELENCVQALQAEGSEVSAQLQYVNRQNFMLSFENQVLKQRLNSMLQEQLKKLIQNDILEREVHRLHQLFQQQRASQAFTIPRSY